ncbi:hypothetical protein IDH44_08275 [Paenibacillus sp. IB182496]|uniref:Uncharacterized protein n=1 Tax=Paenibacillus sabuli TaxID=2772509 RepID=A0A927BT40_9BACL|nr:hypothetical protein [Paenibacillus sabuli]MBD2845185.1 hypothetical protein [Paenibacillus sabuli]
MNAGFFTFWLLGLAGILVLTGWRRELLGTVRLRALLVFGVVWAVLLPVNWALTSTLSIRLSLVWQMGWAIGCLLLAKLRSQALYHLFATAIVGALVYWIRVLYLYDPVFVVIHPFWDTALAAGLLAGILSPLFAVQFSILTLALALAQLLLHRSAMLHIPLGSASWQDGFFAALAIARTVSGMAAIAAHLRTRLAPYWLGEDGGGSS